jgi:hypothetical protein
VNIGFAYVASVGLYVRHIACAWVTQRRRPQAPCRGYEYRLIRPNLRAVPDSEVLVLKHDPTHSEEYGTMLRLENKVCLVCMRSMIDIFVIRKIAAQKEVALPENPKKLCLSEERLHVVKSMRW